MGSPPLAAGAVHRHAAGEVAGDGSPLEVCLVVATITIGAIQAELAWKDLLDTLNQKGRENDGFSR